MTSRASSGVAVYVAWNTSTNVFAVGDTANHTIYFVKDGVLTTPTNAGAITELSGAAFTGMRGAYAIAWTSSEGTCNTLWVGGNSSSANISIIPITYTFENLPVLPTTLLVAGSGVNISQVNGAATNTSTAVFGVNVVSIGGVIANGSLATNSVNVVQFNGAAAQTSLAQVGVNLVTWEGLSPLALTSGLVQSNATATVSGTVSANVIQILGAAVQTSTAQLGVNLVTWEGLTPLALTSGLVQSNATATVSGTVNANIIQINGAAAVTSTAQLGVNVVTYATGQDPGSLVLKTPANLLATASSGLALADVRSWNAAPVVTITTVSGMPGVNLIDIAGAAVNTAAAQLGVNAVNIAGQPAALDANNLLKVDVEDITGNAVVTSSAQIGVNVFTIGGTVALGSLAQGSVNTVKIGGVSAVTSLALGQVNIIQWNGGGLFGNVAPDFMYSNSATLQSGNTASVVTLGSGVGNVDGQYNGQLFFLRTGSSEVGAASTIVSFVAATKAATLNPPLPFAPNTGDAYTIMVANGNSSSSQANVVAWLGVKPAPLNNTLVQGDVERWGNVVVNALISGRVDSNVGQMQNNAIATGNFTAGSLTTTVFANAFLTSALIDTTFSNAVADALLDRANAIEISLTPRQSWRLVAASQGGTLSGAGTTTVGIYGAGVNTTRISAVTDQSGNRSSVTLSL